MVLQQNRSAHILFVKARCVRERNRIKQEPPPPPRAQPSRAPCPRNHPLTNTPGLWAYLHVSGVNEKVLEF